MVSTWISRELIRNDLVASYFSVISFLVFKVASFIHIQLWWTCRLFAQLILCINNLTYCTVLLLCVNCNELWITYVATLGNILLNLPWFWFLCLLSWSPLSFQVGMKCMHRVWNELSVNSNVIRMFKWAVLGSVYFPAFPQWLSHHFVSFCRKQC